MQTASFLPDPFSILSALPDLYLVLSPDLIIITATDAYLSATLTSRERLQGKSILEALPDHLLLSPHDLQHSLEEVLRSGKMHQMDIQHWPVYQSERLGERIEEQYWRVLHTPVLAGQKVAYILHQLRDVTQEVKDQQQIRALTAEAERLSIQQQATLTQAQQEQERLAELLMNAPALIGLVRGESYVYELVNSHYQQLFPGRHLLGKPLLEAVPEIKGHPIVGILDRVYQTGERFIGQETPIPLDRRGKGQLETVYFNFVYQAVRNAEGKVNGIITFAYDVTELVLARQQVEALNRELEERVALRTSELVQAQAEAVRQRRRLERFFMQAPAAICVLDGPQLFYELVNPRYQQLLPGRRLLGLPLLEAIPEMASQPTWSILQQVYRTGETYEGREVAVEFARHPNAPLETHYFNFTYQARTDELGRVDGIMVVAYEVTELVLAQQSLEKLSQELTKANEELAASNEQVQVNNEELRRVNQDLDTFVYTASHDLRAPINQMEGLLGLLAQHLQGQLPPSDQEMVSHMQRAMANLKQILRDLSQIVQVQQETLPREPLSLQEMLSEIQIELTPLLAESQAQVSIALEVSHLSYPRKHLRSILYNLLSNAFKYRSPDRVPQVRVRTYRQEGFTVLEVADNGLGLSAEQLPKLFEIYQRMHPHVEGTGIGLYMIKRIVENNCGRIRVESQAGMGTTFRVYFRA